MRWSAGRGSLVLALICGAIPIHAAQVIIVVRPGGTGWQVVEAEKVTFNQREKLRTASSQSLDLRPDAYKKLPQVEIVRAGTLRRHAGGYLVRRMEGGWVPVGGHGAEARTAPHVAAARRRIPCPAHGERLGTGGRRRCAGENRHDLRGLVVGGYGGVPGAGQVQVLHASAG